MAGILWKMRGKSTHRSAHTPENIERVQFLIESDRCMAIDDLAHETGLSHDIVFTILNEDLRLTTLCIRTRIKN